MPISTYLDASAMGAQIQALTDRLNAEENATAAASGRLDSVEGWQGERVKYLYPNGGTEAVPAGLALAAVYSLPSPFQAGTAFSAEVQVRNTAGVWVDHKASFYEGSLGGYGVMSAKAADFVTVTTGNMALGSAEQNMGGSVAGWSGANYNSAEYRIKCVRED